MSHETEVERVVYEYKTCGNTEYGENLGISQSIYISTWNGLEPSTPLPETALVDGVCYEYVGVYSDTLDDDTFISSESVVTNPHDLTCEQRERFNDNFNQTIGMGSFELTTEEFEDLFNPRIGSYDDLSQEEKDAIAVQEAELQARVTEARQRATEYVELMSKYEWPAGMTNNPLRIPSYEVHPFDMGFYNDFLPVEDWADELEDSYMEVRAAVKAVTAFARRFPIITIAEKLVSFNKKTQDQFLLENVKSMIVCLAWARHMMNNNFSLQFTGAWDGDWERNKKYLTEEQMGDIQARWYDLELEVTGHTQTYVESYGIHPIMQTLKTIGRYAPKTIAPGTQPDMHPSMLPLYLRSTEDFNEFTMKTVYLAYDLVHFTNTLHQNIEKIQELENNPPEEGVTPTPTPTSNVTSTDQVECTETPTIDMNDESIVFIRPFDADTPSQPQVFIGVLGIDDDVDGEYELQSEIETRSIFLNSLQNTERPSMWFARGLPAGVNINSVTGELSCDGRILNGYYPVTLFAVNRCGEETRADIVINVGGELVWDHMKSGGLPGPMEADTDGDDAVCGECECESQAPPPSTSTLIPDPMTPMGPPEIGGYWIPPSPESNMGSGSDEIYGDEVHGDEVHGDEVHGECAHGEWVHGVCVPETPPPSPTEKFTNLYRSCSGDNVIYAYDMDTNPPLVIEQYNCPAHYELAECFSWEKRVTGVLSGVLENEVDGCGVCGYDWLYIKCQYEGLSVDTTLRNAFGLECDPPPMIIEGEQCWKRVGFNYTDTPSMGSFGEPALNEKGNYVDCDHLVCCKSEGLCGDEACGATTGSDSIAHTTTEPIIIPKIAVEYSKLRRIEVDITDGAECDDFVLSVDDFYEHEKCPLEFYWEPVTIRSKKKNHGWYTSDAAFEKGPVKGVSSELYYKEFIENPKVCGDLVDIDVGGGELCEDGTLSSGVNIENRKPNAGDILYTNIPETPLIPEKPDQWFYIESGDLVVKIDASGKIVEVRDKVSRVSIVESIDDYPDLISSSPTPTPTPTISPPDNTQELIDTSPVSGHVRTGSIFHNVELNNDEVPFEIFYKSGLEENALLQLTLDVKSLNENVDSVWRQLVEHKTGDARYAFFDMKWTESSNPSCDISCAEFFTDILDNNLYNWCSSWEGDEYDVPGIPISTNSLDGVGKFVGWLVDLQSDYFSTTAKVKVLLAEDIGDLMGKSFSIIKSGHEFTMTDKGVVGCVDWSSDLDISVDCLNNPCIRNLEFTLAENSPEQLSNLYESTYDFTYNAVLSIDDVKEDFVELGDMNKGDLVLPTKISDSGRVVTLGNGVLLVDNVTDGTCNFRGESTYTGLDYILVGNTTQKLITLHNPNNVSMLVGLKPKEAMVGNYDAPSCWFIDEENGEVSHERLESLAAYETIDVELYASHGQTLLISSLYGCSVEHPLCEPISIGFEQQDV